MMGNNQVCLVFVSLQNNQCMVRNTTGTPSPITPPLPMDTPLRSTIVMLQKKGKPLRQAKVRGRVC